MTTFNDAIADAVVPKLWDWLNGADNSLGVADALLAMPEMQAVRALLHKMATETADDSWKDSPADVLQKWGLPESVVAWVLDSAPQRWQPVELDDTGCQCSRCGEPVGLVDTEDHTGGMFPVPAWQCRVNGELVCEDCHGQDGGR